MSQSIWKSLRRAVVGKARSPLEAGVFQHVALIAFFAWVGLGADGLSSACYGPEEAFLALHDHPYLSIFVALASVFTIFIISASYSHIIELFPTGGGGYLVASKLLSPSIGAVSGCALLIDYVLTITISAAAGANAVFSLLPPEYQEYKIMFAACALIILMLLNLRGVRESVIPLVPVFMLFVVTHFFVVIYAVTSNVAQVPDIIHGIADDIHATRAEMGIWAMLALILKAYSMGAGTFTGIEAVSNGLPILREPKVVTGKRTMFYMAFSLSFTVVGLMIGYLIFNVRPQEGMTLNAVLFEAIARDWGKAGQVFVWATLWSEALLLMIAAQAGFLDGPRVMANMATDRWLPARFSLLSDRLVNQNGILWMGAAALVILLWTHGSVKYLIVLYSINVFITFTLSQLGMVRHWWKHRKTVPDWLPKLSINGLGFLLTFFILMSVVILKFTAGGWATLIITGSLVLLAFLIRRHYLNTARMLARLNDLIPHATNFEPAKEKVPFKASAKTAVILVNGFNGLGLHTLFNVIRFFGKSFGNFVFVEIGVVDAGNFKGSAEVENLKASVQKDLDRYVSYTESQGFHAESMSRISCDIVEECEVLIEDISRRFPNAVYFGGQLVFPHETLWTRWLHNYTVFALQRRFYNTGRPFVILPIRV